jgi:hypothetical protein
MDLQCSIHIGISYPAWRGVGVFPNARHETAVGHRAER